MNNSRNKGIFRENYEKLFDLKLPHMDIVDKFLAKLETADIEEIKLKMIQYIINKKILHKFRLMNMYVVAIDGTVISTYDYEPWEGCPYKDYKSGKRVWLVPVTEAKIVCVNGLSLSIATEWNINTGKYDKQDCEQNAFLRLTEKLKNDFPRLPICITADGLYPNKTTFEICKNNNWRYIITLKDGNLKTLWEDIKFELTQNQDNTRIKILLNKPKHKLMQSFMFLNNLEYKGFELSWIECIENETTSKTTTRNRFVHITDIQITKDNVDKISNTGRLRWKIENEGFDIQKNHGYNLKHKFSRKSLVSRKNYYQCLQIAHIINQLTEKSQVLLKAISAKDSLKSILENIIAFMLVGTIEQSEIQCIWSSNCQIRY